MEQFTVRSRENLEKLGSGMPAKEIMEFLEKGLEPRKFSDILKKVYPGADLRDKLRGGLMEMEGAALQREMTDYKVNRWLNDDLIPAPDAMGRIFHALGLSQAAEDGIRRELQAEPKKIREILGHVYLRGNLEERLRNGYPGADERRSGITALLDTSTQNCLDENGELLLQWSTVINEFCSILRLKTEETKQVLDEVRASRKRFFYILKNAYPAEDLCEKIRGEFYETESAGEKKKQRERIRHSVNNWLNDSNTPSRENLFKICFALGLDYSQSEEVIGAFGMPIHHRNPKELVWAYGLWNGLSWGKVQVLKEELDQRYTPGMRWQRINEGREELIRLRQEKKTVTEDVKETYQDEIQAYKIELKQQKRELDEQTRRKKIVYSETLRDEFFDAASDEEKFIQFYGYRCNELEKFHETSYREFKKMMELLQREYYDVVKEEKWDGSQKLSDDVNDIAARYFNAVVPTKQKPMMRAIRKNWPDGFELGAMMRREKDVSREVMIMLSLALDIFEEVPLPETDLIPAEYRKRLGFLIPKTPYDRMISRMEQLKQFLEKCGMTGLDPRNPFDCAILYAMTAAYDLFEETMSDKLKKLMDETLEDQGNQNG